MSTQPQFTAEEQAELDFLPMELGDLTSEQRAKLEKELARLKRNAERREARERQKANDRRAARQREQARVNVARMEALRRDPIYQELKREKELARIKANADRREARERLKKKSEGTKVDEEELARVQRNTERREACHRLMKERKEVKELVMKATKMNIS